jgi:hypothetical protein
MWVQISSDPCNYSSSYNLSLKRLEGIGKATVTVLPKVMRIQFFVTELHLQASRNNNPIRLVSSNALDAAHSNCSAVTLHPLYVTLTDPYTCHLLRISDDVSLCWSTDESKTPFCDLWHVSIHSYANCTRSPNCITSVFTLTTSLANWQILSCLLS